MVVFGAGAVTVVEAWTSVNGALSPVLVLGAEGSEGELDCLTGESVLGADWSVLAARALEDGVGEPTCAWDSVTAPSNAAVPQMRFLRRLNIGLNGS